MTSVFAPMLAVSSEPFDSNEFLFEVKWDGVRALASIDRDHGRIWGREQADYTGRYPELEELRSLPSGTVLDGELVVLRNGRADFGAILRRHHLTSAFKIKQASRHWRVTYIAFDCLHHQGHALLNQPLATRREVLADLVAKAERLPLMLSEGMIGCGKTFFDKAVEQGHEGAMGKQLSSTYLPGRRSSAWRKIKPWQTTVCVIIGYTPAENCSSSELEASTGERPRNSPLRFSAIFPLLL